MSTEPQERHIELHRTPPPPPSPQSAPPREGRASGTATNTLNWGASGISQPRQSPLNGATRGYNLGRADYVGPSKLDFLVGTRRPGGTRTLHLCRAELYNSYYRAEGELQPLNPRAPGLLYPHLPLVCRSRDPVLAVGTAPISVRFGRTALAPF